MEKTTSVFRINQTGYAAGKPVRLIVLSDSPVFLLDSRGKKEDNMPRTVCSKE